MSVQVRDIHARSLATSSALSEYYVPNLITPLDVIRVLNAAKVRFMLLGAHGIGGWMGKPRATEDVDVLVAARGHKKGRRGVVEGISAFASGRPRSRHPFARAGDGNRRH